MSLWCSVTKTAVVDTGQEYTFCVVPQVERSVRHRLWCRHCWAKAYQRQNGETHPFAKRTAFLSSTFVLYAHKEPAQCLRGLFLVLVLLLLFIRTVVAVVVGLGFQSLSTGAS